MSEYNIIQRKNPFIDLSLSTNRFFERYCDQFREIFTAGLDFKTIWSQFCEVTNIHATKPWTISDQELETLNNLTNLEIYGLMAKAIGRFWKGDYKGEGF